MIPMMNIIAWGKTVPWSEPKQVEQDLISRAVVELFSDSFLAAELRFRGGTALNKLHFPKPLRYSEDIDLARTTPGPIGPVLDKIRSILEPWLGRADFDQSPVAPKLFFRVKAEDETATAPIRLKVEIATRERTAHDPTRTISYAVNNPWFSGTANVETFSNEEVLATKLRALLQRDKGRDILDLSHAATVFGDLKASRVVELFRTYLADAGQPAVSRAQAEESMLAKIARKSFMADVRPLLSADEREKLNTQAAKAAFSRVFTTFIKLIPGKLPRRPSPLVCRTWSATKHSCPGPASQFRFEVAYATRRDMKRRYSAVLVISKSMIC